MVYSQEDHLWHMYTAEIPCTPEQTVAGQRRCGLGTWSTLSQVAEAVSSSPEGPYERRRLILGAMHHNPTVKIDPVDGSWNLFSISHGSGPIVLNISTDQGLTWSGEQLIFPVMKSQNPGPHFFPNGTLRMYHRHHSDMVGPTCSTEAVGGVDCANKTFCSAAPDDALFSLAFNHAAEDPSVFVDHRGNFHMLVNALPGNCKPKPKIHQGGHAWSRDGIVWSDVRVGAFNTTVAFTDGDFMTCIRRERPQMVLDQDGMPLAMTSGIMGCPAFENGNWTGGQDCFTLVQLVGKTDYTFV